MQGTSAAILFQPRNTGGNRDSEPRGVDGENDYITIYPSYTLSGGGTLNRRYAEAAHADGPLSEVLLHRVPQLLAVIVQVEVVVKILHPYDGGREFSTVLTDPEQIKKIVALHQAIVDNRDSEPRGVATAQARMQGTSAAILFQPRNTEVNMPKHSPAQKDTPYLNRGRTRATATTSPAASTWRRR